jgi:hypothetical protein
VTMSFNMESRPGSNARQVRPGNSSKMDSKSVHAASRRLPIFTAALESEEYSGGGAAIDFFQFSDDQFAVHFERFRVRSSRDRWGFLDCTWSFGPIVPNFLQYLRHSRRWARNNVSRIRSFLCRVLPQRHYYREALPRHVCAGGLRVVLGGSPQVCQARGAQRLCLQIGPCPLSVHLSFSWWCWQDVPPIIPTSKYYLFNIFRNGLYFVANVAAEVRTRDG